MNFWKATKTSVYAEARVLHSGKRIAVAEVDVKDENGKAIAKGLFTYAVTKRKAESAGRSGKGGKDDL